MDEGVVVMLASAVEGEPEVGEATRGVGVSASRVGEVTTGVGVSTRGVGVGVPTSLGGFTS